MINIYLNLEGNKYYVGKLAKTNHGIYFQYEKTFLETGYELSPLKLPLSDQVFKAPDTPFNKLHGVFADSIPDGWGLLLMDRHLN